jgi:hypothetical protein
MLYFPIIKLKQKNNKEILLMNNITLDSLSVGVPESVANMQLPDPNLRDFYRDEVDRTYWLNDVVGEDTLDIVKMIIKCNQED